ncbi:hypothetical protein DRZ77_01460 [Candidatus Woesearchaeota archaeon]|nr:metal-dependent hydrolase [Candidatus Woesearchaeota archaeon]RLE40705.1 MAG: hypothetical protein DRZ77_01460 [Candidatus Woesearchaeota archaeon]
MQWKTHVVFGFLVGLFALNYVRIENKILFFLFVLLGSLLPDIDNPRSKFGSKVKIVGKIFKHRGVFHSAITGVVLSGIVWYFVNATCGIGLFIGYISHLLIDGFTVQGVNFLHPFGKLHLSGFIETGKVGEWIVFGIVVFLILLKLGVFSLLS